MTAQQEPRAQLYSVSFSHPVRAARLMLEHKGIPYELVRVPAGFQAVRVRLAGFRGSTVPALRIDDRRVVGTRAIARALDEIQPSPPLFPADPDRRRRVEEAETWGETVLQPLPRRVLRWALHYDRDARVAFLRVLGNPKPERTARLIGPVTGYLVPREHAHDRDRIRKDWAAFPAHLDHVDALIAEGTIGGAEPNAADFQIGTTIRLMLAIPPYAEAIAGRPSEDLARRLWPRYPLDFAPVLGRFGPEAWA